MISLTKHTVLFQSHTYVAEDAMNYRFLWKWVKKNLWRWSFSIYTLTSSSNTCQIETKNMLFQKDFIRGSKVGDFSIYSLRTYFDSTPPRGTHRSTWTFHVQTHATSPRPVSRAYSLTMDMASDAFLAILFVFYERLLKNSRLESNSFWVRTHHSRTTCTGGSARATSRS